MRVACPGLSVTSRVSPLRLLSSPITATRCAIGVPPLASDAAPVSIVSIEIVAGLVRARQILLDRSDRRGATVGHGAVSQPAPDHHDDNQDRRSDPPGHPSGVQAS
ncbi:hypothetical protein [Sphingomonas sp. 22R3R2A-7]|uniref:hypothetical protein n=1 Tax=Sphingomonas sp. 22R3R2A-7 TaxID=3050230 RepID=UPI002FE3E1FE